MIQQLGSNYFLQNKIGPADLAPIAVKILLCWCSAQKIGTNSGKKLKKKIILNPRIILNLKKY